MIIKMKKFYIIVCKKDSFLEIIRHNTITYGNWADVHTAAKELAATDKESDYLIFGCEGGFGFPTEPVFKRVEE
jgi:hypothetical protein